MKSLLKFAICAMTVIAVAASCDNKEEGDDAPQVTKVQKTWTASFVDVTSAAGGQNASLPVVLSADDAISVFSGRQNQRADAVSADAAAKTAVFSAEVVEAEKYYALYPYQSGASSSNDAVSASIPQAQTLSEGAMDPAARFYVAKTSNEQLRFTPAFGLIALSFENADEIVSMTLKAGADTDRLSGMARINLTTGNIAVINGTNTIALSGAPADGKVYYVSVIPGTYTGLVLVLVNQAGLTAEMTLSEGEFTVPTGKYVSVSVDLEDAEWILRPFENQSYELKTAAEVEDFVQMKPTPKEEVVNLTISGTAITDELLAQISGRVGSVKGSLVWDNVGATTTAGFFDEIECKGDITIKDCASLTDGSGLAAYEAVGGALKLSGLSLGFGGENGLFGALTTVGGDFIVENMGEGFTSFEGLNLTSVGGNISITGNSALEDLTGLDGLTRIGGSSITIFDNPELVQISDEVKGYCLVRDFMDAGALSTSATVTLGTTDAPVDFSNLPACDGTRPGELKSYVLNGSAAVQNFVAAAVEGTKESVKNLTFRGDVTTADLSTVQNRVGRITGTLTFEDITWTEDGKPDGWSINMEQIIPHFLVDGVFEGSVVFRRISGIINPNGFSNMTEIKGDFIVEDCPRFPLRDWPDATKNLRRVGGHFRRINCDPYGSLNTTGLGSLEEVGGDFELAGFGYFYSLNGITKLMSIGGDLIIRDCANFWGFNGFQNLTYLGGDVVVTDYGLLPERSGLVDGNEVLGICFIRDLMNNGVLDSSANVTVIKDTENASETTVDFSKVVSCSAVLEDDETAGHEKYPNPDPVTGWN